MGGMLRPKEPFTDNKKPCVPDDTAKPWNEARNSALVEFQGKHGAVLLKAMQETKDRYVKMDPTWDKIEMRYVETLCSGRCDGLLRDIIGALQPTLEKLKENSSQCTPDMLVKSLTELQNSGWKHYVSGTVA